MVILFSESVLLIFKTSRATDTHDKVELGILTPCAAILATRWNP